MAVNLLSDLSESFAELSSEYEEIVDKLQNGGELNARDQQVSSY